MKCQHFLMFLLLIGVVNSQVATISVTERRLVNRTGEPVTAGIPVPLQLNLLSANSVRLLDEAGNAVPAQIRVTGRWDGAPTDATKPIRWLLADFQTDISAGQTKRFQVERGQPAALTDSISVSDASGLITVNTGAAQFRINKQSFNLFDRVVIGDQVVVDGGTGQGIPIASGSNTYGITEVSSCIVEENGPLKTVVKIVGKNSTFADFTCRMQFYYNKSYVKVFYRVENNRQSRLSNEGQPADLHNLGSTNSISFDDLSLNVQMASPGQLNYRVQGDKTARSGSLDQALLLYQESNGLDKWNAHQGNGLRNSAHVSFKGYHMTLGSSSIEQGDSALGWCAIEDQNKGIMGGCRDFWQQYPKAVRATTQGVLQVSLFPTEFPAINNTKFNFRIGEYKVHETYFYFYRGSKTANELSVVAQTLNEPLIGFVGTREYIISHALHEFPEYLNKTGADSQDTLFEKTIKTLVDDNIGKVAGWVQPTMSKSMVHSVNVHGMYGFQDYGDIPLDFETARGQYGLKYNAGLGFLIQFFRTNDFRFWELGENGERHEGDMDIIHTGRTNRQYYWDGAYYGHSWHNENGDNNPHRNSLGGNPDIMFAVPGLLLYYYLTGYQWAYEYAVEVSDNALFKVNGGCCLDHNNLRAMSNTVNVLTEIYRATGDSKYGNQIEPLINIVLNTASFFTTEMSFMTFDFLRNMGMYIDYKEMITGTTLTTLRNQLVEKAVICKGRALFDDGRKFAILFDYSDWNRSASDMYGFAYKYSNDTSHYNFGSRLLNTGIFENRIGVGYSPSDWKTELVVGPRYNNDSAGVIHYYGANVGVNTSLSGLCFMSVKHPVNSGEVNNFIQKNAAEKKMAKPLITVRGSKITIAFPDHNWKKGEAGYELYSLQGKLIQKKAIPSGTKYHSIIIKKGAGVYILKVKCQKSVSSMAITFGK